MKIVDNEVCIIPVYAQFGMWINNRLADIYSHLTIFGHGTGDFWTASCCCVYSKLKLSADNIQTL